MDKVTTGRRPYQPPKLTMYGDMARFTASGKGSVKESEGKAESNAQKIPRA